jgi:hypothetical protein
MKGLFFLSVPRVCHLRSTRHGGVQSGAVRLASRASKYTSAIRKKGLRPEMAADLLNPKRSEMSVHEAA